MSGRNTYDLTTEQQEIIQQRHARRMQLREMYLKDVGHPTKSLLFDTGIYRYGASKTSMIKHFEPTMSTSTVKLMFIGGLFVYAIIYGKKSKDAQELKLRSGQVSYAERWSKFV